MATDSGNRRLSFSSGQWAEFNRLDHRYLTCVGRMHVKDAATWVNIGQAAVAVVDMMLFASFYLIKWADPNVKDTFDTKFLLFGICLFGINLLFAGLLHAGLRYESCGLIVADLGWMTVSTTLRGLSVVLLIIELVHYPNSSSWLSAGLIACLVSFIIQSLSCYILTRCAYYMRHVRVHRRRTEIMAAARLLMVQYWRPPSRQPNPPPPYTVISLNVPPTYDTATRTAEGHRDIVERIHSGTVEEENKS